MILMNVVMDGQIVDDRMIWSDLNRPLAFKPNPGISAATYADLGHGEGILNAQPMGDSLIIYTTQGIWEGFFTGDPNQVLTFRKRFNGTKAGNRCLAYKKTLASTGDEHYYLGRDGVYLYNFYLPAPERVEWIHGASSIIFDEIDENNCNAHVGGYDAKNKTLWFSWATLGNACPNKSIAINTEFHSAAFVDHGFSVFTNYNPDSPKTLRDWILEECICTSAEMDALGFGFIKEGEYCVEPQPSPPCTPVPNSIYTTITKVVDDVIVEDWGQASASDGSLCALLGDATINEMCGAELTADECNAEQVFVGASTSDYALKQIGGVYYRERSLNHLQCGTYLQEGYKTILRSGPIDLREPDFVKNISRLVVEADPAEQVEPSDLNLRVGAAPMAADPNSAKCSITWRDEQARKLKCPTGVNQPAGTRPGMGLEWPIFVDGRFFYFELSVDGAGGASCFSRISLFARMRKGF